MTDKMKKVFHGVGGRIAEKWKQFRAGGSVEGGLGRFTGGILAGTLALAWFPMPWLLPRVMFFLYRIGCGIATGDAPEVPVREAAVGALYWDDLVPDELVALLLVVLAAGTFLLLREVIRRRPTARWFGLVYQIAALAAVGGIAANECLDSGVVGMAPRDVLIGAGLLGLALLSGILAACQGGIRRWFAGEGDGDGDGCAGNAMAGERVFAPFRRWTYIVLGAAAVLSLYLGGSFVGVCRHVGVTTRDSRMSMGQVLVVQNHGERPALCAMEIKGVHCERFLLAEGESKEFGILETDRVLEGGTTGRLSVEGYRRGLRFSMENKSAAISGKSVHSVAKTPTEAYVFAAGIPLAFGQKPSRIGGAVLEVKNTSDKETVRGTLSVNGGEETVEVTLAPGEMKTFGRLELFRALRKGDRVEVSLVGFQDTAQYEIAEEKLASPVEP